MSSSPLTKRQRELLAELPREPHEGRHCWRAEFRIASALVEKGLARQTRKGQWSGGYFVCIDPRKGKGPSDD